MMFKGTAKRSAREIAETLDAVGGHLNAFTDKEYTCYYSKVLGDELGLAFDVLSDMLTGSLFDPIELDLEKNVVLEEIKRHDDTPDDLIHDIYSEILWPDHPLGRRVIGRSETVSSFNRDVLLQYVAKHYTPDQIVIAAAGRIQHQDLVDAADTVFGSLEGKQTSRPMTPPIESDKRKVVTKETEQVHFCLGTSGFSQLDDDKYTLAVIDTLLGGGMSSRLFQEVREKRGLAYSVGSYANSYLEGGMFTIYAGTSPDQLDEVLEISRNQLKEVASGGITEEEVHRAKSQLRGNLYLGLENTTNRMTRLGKSELYHGRFVSPDEVVEKIEAVTMDEVHRVGHLISDKPMAYAAIGPFDPLPEGE
jgi:predicted Zn-dependent peptidase